MHVKPPHDDIAERAVLGAMMRDNATIPRVAELLGAADFYNFAHQVLFKAAVDLSLRQQKPVDPVTLADYVHAAQAVEDIGGYPYLATLWESCPSPASAVYYAEIVVKKSICRQLLSWSAQVQKAAYDRQQNVAELLDDARDGLESIEASFARIADKKAAILQKGA